MAEEPDVVLPRNETEAGLGTMRKKKCAEKK